MRGRTRIRDFFPFVNGFFREPGDDARLVEWIVRRRYTVPISSLLSRGVLWGELTRACSREVYVLQCRVHAYKLLEWDSHFGELGCIAARVEF